MGYRLKIEVVGKSSPSYYGTKLYGYEDETKLKSYQWLLNNGYLDSKIKYNWDYNNDNPILMKIEDFEIFAKLYNDDLNNFLDDDKNYFINDEEIQQILRLNEWEYVVIMWQ